MTRPMPEQREEVLEAAQRVVDAFAWAANYKPHRNRPERDAFHVARALLSGRRRPYRTNRPISFNGVFFMDDINEDIASKLLATLQQGLSDESTTALKKKVSDIIYEIETDVDYRLKEELAPNLVSFVAEMARRTVESILDGNQAMMEKYLGCERGHWTGRSDSPTWGAPRRDEDWHPVIHGKLFETGAIAVRKRIVEAHRDLITDQRILDLEDQVRSLVAQNNKQADRISKLEDERRYA